MTRMKSAALIPVLAVVGSIAFALDGQIGIHDPSTIVMCNNKFYTWGTGGSGLVSEIIYSAIGAIILLLIVRLLRGGGRF